MCKECDRARDKIIKIVGEIEIVAHRMDRVSIYSPEWTEDWEERMKLIDELMEV